MTKSLNLAPCFLVVLCFLLACNVSSKEQQGNLNKPTDTLVSKDTAIIDQYKVIGGIQFGMGETEVNSLIKKFKKETKKASKTFAGEYDSFIGDYQYTNINGFYNQKKLYWLQIRGYPILWEYYNARISNAVKSATDVLVSRFGKPTFSEAIPERYSMQKGFTYTINEWDLGTKKIDIRIEDSETSYSVNIYIYQPEVVKEIEAREKKLSDSTSSASKDVF